MTGLTADRRLWLNADKTKVVDETSGEAAHLLAAQGDLITSEWVEQLGLESQEGKIVQRGAAVPAAEPPVAAAAPDSPADQPVEE